MNTLPAALQVLVIPAQLQTAQLQQLRTSVSRDIAAVCILALTPLQSKICL